MLGIVLSVHTAPCANVRGCFLGDTCDTNLTSCRALGYGLGGFGRTKRIETGQKAKNPDPKP